jgi:protein SCO1/2
MMIETAKLESGGAHAANCRQVQQLAWRLGLAWLALIVLTLTQCTALGHYTFHGSVIDPPTPAPDFVLRDQRGHVFRLSDQTGKLVLLYFGYTSCPDVCPTTLAVLKRTRMQLDRQAEQVRVVFVTVDQERDSAERIGAYLGAFDSTFVGLTGAELDLEPVWRAYSVYRQKQPGSSALGYTVDHTARIYLIDTQGQLRLTFPFGITADDIAPDVRHLLAQK